MGLTQRFGLVDEAQRQMAVLLARPALDLLAPVADDEDDLAGPDGGAV